MCQFSEDRHCFCYHKLDGTRGLDEDDQKICSILLRHDAGRRKKAEESSSSEEWSLVFIQYERVSMTITESHHSFSGRW